MINNITCVIYNSGADILNDCTELSNYHIFKFSNSQTTPSASKLFLQLLKYVQYNGQEQKGNRSSG